MKKKKKRNGILQILSKPLVTQVDNNDDDDDDVTNVLILPKKSLWLFPQKIDSVWAKTNDSFKCRNCSSIFLASEGEYSLKIHHVCLMGKLPDCNESLFCPKMKKAASHFPTFQH